MRSNEDMEELWERVSGGGVPPAAFQEQVLQVSLAALARSRHSRARWHAAALSAAAVVIAGVSFLLGRCSLPPAEIQTTPAVTLVAAGGRTATVPSEVIAWLDAARLFRQLGMEDRMARAVDHAHSLLPYNAVAGCSETGLVFAAGGGAVERESKHVSLADASNLRQSVERVNRIMAQSLGD